jgi:hypothetical protein
MTDLKISEHGGPTGATLSAEQTQTFLRKDGTYQSPSVVNGPLTLNGGTNTSASAPVITSPGFSSGVASQLSDTTRDYIVYFTIAGGGGTVTIAIGPTSSPANTIVSSATGVAGVVIPIRLPAGWYLEITVATSTIGRQIAVGC